MSRRLRWIAGLTLLAACQERLAAPADCPTLCPGGYDVRDTVLTPVPGGDSAFIGYVRAGQGSSLRVSHQFPASEDLAVIRFSPRPDSLLQGDSLLPYTIDSIALEFSVLYRDTTVKNLKLYLYRLPRSVDSTVTWAEVDAAFTPPAVVDSFAMDDTLTSQRFRRVFSGADLTTVDIPPADSGVLALGVQIRADQGTGVRIGGIGAGSGAPAFVNYIQVPKNDSETVANRISPVVAFNTFVSQSPLVVDPDLLLTGGAPSARSLLRFPWPPFLRDSAQLVRATLELYPSGPVPGLRGDTAFIQARPVLADFGGKSPTSTDAFYIGFNGVLPGQVDTVAMEVRHALLLWQGSKPLPPAFVLQLLPEASSFSHIAFGSTRSGLQPQLRITYARKFPFQEP